jgi:hypothetical protein
MSVSRSNIHQRYHVQRKKSRKTIESEKQERRTEASQMSVLRPMWWDETCVVDLCVAALACKYAPGKCAIEEQ